MILLAGWFAREVFEGETMTFDNAVRDQIHSLASPALTSAMLVLSIIGSPLTVVLTMAAACIVLLYNGLTAEALLVAGTGAAELVLNSVLKLIYLRERPSAYFDYPLPASFSFPSGHAFGSFCVFGILAFVISSHLKTPGGVRSLRIGAGLLILLVGASRIYLGVHYPTDVLAGFLLGAIVVSLAIILYRRAVSAS